MSYLLNHIDNNRSEDDEDDHINQLFPKCKPRASSLSLSPSLQHINNHHHHVGSPSSTSASDLCLNSSSNYLLSPPNSNQQNSNLFRLDSSNSRNYRYSSNRRHSANSNQFNDNADGIDSSSQQSLWSTEEFTIFPCSEDQAQLGYQNNNNIENSDNYLLTDSCETLNHSSGETTFTTRVDRGHTNRSGLLKHTKNCENHVSTANHKQKQPNCKGCSNCDRSKVGNGGESTPNPTQQSRTTSKIYYSAAAPKSKVEQEVKENNPSRFSESNFSSVILHRPQNLRGACSAKTASTALNQPLLSSPVLVEHQRRKMDQQHSIEDMNFDNGIGSGCSRSSGESTHSNTSDFMENLVSPVASIRDRGRVGSGSGGTLVPSVITPSTSFILGSLRDSRSIEIAGGREIFSQNRIRASRRHRGGSSHANELMAETVIPACALSSTKMRKKSLHSHNAPYQHQGRHCCHSSPCCGHSGINNCGEGTLPPHGSLVWEPNNHNCRRGTEVVVSGSRQQQYMSHSHSFGGTTATLQCVKCTEGVPTSACGCCGHHGSFEYAKVSGGVEFDGGSRLSCNSSRNIPKLHNNTSSPTSITMRETIFASEVRSIEKSTPRGPGVTLEDKSVLLHRELGSPCRIEPVIYEAVVGDGKVVFDDIGEWRERVGDNGGYDGGDEHDTSESQGSKKRQMQQGMIPISKDKEESHLNAPATTTTSSTITNSTSINNMQQQQQQRVKRITTFSSNNVAEPSESSPCASNRDGNTTPSGYESDEFSVSACTNTSILSAHTNLKTSPNFGSNNKKLIGSIPIAEYEGSPKRYGLKQTAHPVTTHFDLIDVDIGVEARIHLQGENEDQVINTDPNAQSLDQTIAATTSSSSSSLDNTNTNVSSNSSSRTNNRISPRALSPSQPAISAAFSARFPGFPQRVNASSNNPSQESTNTRTQPCPLVDYSELDSNNLAGTNHELLSSVNNDLTRSETRNGRKMGENEMGHHHPPSSSSSPSSCGSNKPGDTATTTNTTKTEQLIRIETSPFAGSRTNSYNSQPHISSTNLDQQHAALLQCSLLEDNFLIDSPQVVRSSAPDPRNQDFLYEFSETRKVLEEFFNSAGGGGSPGSSCSRVGARGGQFLADKASFDELDYMLKRQAGNSYVGQRLSDIAGNLVAEDSPKKPPRRGVLLLGSNDGDGSDEKGSPKLISFQEISLPQQLQLHQPPVPHQRRPSQTPSSTRSPPRVSLKTHSRSQSQSPPLHDPTTRDINDNNIDTETASTNTETDLGETEVGLRVGNGRNFALSPETTDCDSNELESELSLDYETSLLPSIHRVVGGGVGGIPLRRPMVVEDVRRGGLSSGNESENEDIIEVDVGYRDDCYLMGNSKITKPGPNSSITLLANKSRQNDLSTTDVKLYTSGEDNKENILELVNSTPSFSDINVTSNILSWSNSDDLILNIQDEIGSRVAGDNNSGDPNPTLMLMKKQISEIEKEIQLRASQQSQNNKSQNGTGGNLVDTEIDMDDRIELPESATPTNNSDIGQVVPSPPNNRQLNGKLDGSGETCAPTQFSRRNPFAQMTEVVDEGLESSTSLPVNHDPELDALDPMRPTPPPSPAPGSIIRQQHYPHAGNMWKSNSLEQGKASSNFNPHQATSHPCERSDPLYMGESMSSSSSGMQQSHSPPTSVSAAIQDIKEAIQRTKPLPQPRRSSTVSTSIPIASTSHSRSDGILESQQQSSQSPPQSQEHVPLICDSSPVWVPRHPRAGGRNRDPRADSQAKDPLLKKQRYEDKSPEDDANTDTDTETDRLLGQTRTEDDCGFFDEKDWKKAKSRSSLLPSLNKGVAFVKSAASPSSAPLLSTSASISGGGNNSISAAASSSNSFNTTTINNSFTNNANNVSSTAATSNSSASHLIHPLSPTNSFDDSQVQLSSSTGSIAASKSKKEKDGAKKKRSKEDLLKNPSVLIEGVLFRARYLGSTQLTCEGQPTKATRMMQAEEAVSRIKAESSTNEMQQGPIPPPNSGPSSFPTSPKSDSSNPLSTSTPTNTITETNKFETSAVICSINNRISRGVGEMVVVNRELDHYLYGRDDEESCSDDSEEDLFLKTAHSQTRRFGSLGSLRDNSIKGMMRLPLEEATNALQIHDNAHPQSLRHNRRTSGETCTSESTTTSQSTFLNSSPPCASATPGTMFRLKFVGSLEVDEEVGNGKRRRKRPKKIMVEEAVMKLKSMAPEGETQPSTEVDLFISTEKIMVLNTDLKEIMMDHALRTISYIADIGDLVVLMARRRPVPTDPVDDSKPPRPPKMICHVFESDEAQYIAQSIGQAFQVAYMEFLKANGIEDSSFVREMDYQEVLNSQEIFGDELQMFAKKELQKEVVVPKSKGEILGVVIVESGWGSMLPTVVIANLAPAGAGAGAAARCGQLNIGDQIIAINGVSLVGLPLSTCQNYIKNTKNQTVVKLTVVPCPPVVEVKIKRPDTKYQLGFSVQNGVICSLLRGGIAERGGVRVGHRIIEINSQSVVAVPHEKIVNLLATSVGEINMKTMPTSMFRLLTGQENPLYI